jgi:hypothetical protein
MQDLSLFLMSRREVEIERLRATVSSRPLLWLPVMLWAIVENQTVVLELISIPYPPDAFLDSIFHAMMLKLTNPPGAWMGVLDVADFDIKVQYPPPSVDFLVGLIQEQLVSIASSTNFQRTSAINVIISWRSWIAVFGVTCFLDHLLGFLKRYVLAYAEHDGLLEMYKISAFILLSCSREWHDELLAKLLAYANEGLEDARNAVFYAWLVIIYISGRKGHAVEDFKVALRLCEDILNSSDDGGSPEVSFSLCLIRLALKLPHLRPLLHRGLVPLVTKMNDWRTAIDLYRLADVVHE